VFRNTSRLHIIFPLNEKINFQTELLPCHHNVANGFKSRITKDTNVNQVHKILPVKLSQEQNPQRSSGISDAGSMEGTVRDTHGMIPYLFTWFS